MLGDLALAAEYASPGIACAGHVGRMPSPGVQESLAGAALALFKRAPVLCITFTLLSWGAIRHALALNLGSPAIS